MYQDQVKNEMVLDSLERRRLIERHITKFNDWKLIRRKEGVLKILKRKGK